MARRWAAWRRPCASERQSPGTSSRGLADPQCPGRGLEVCGSATLSVVAFGGLFLQRHSDDPRFLATVAGGVGRRWRAGFMGLELPTHLHGSRRAEYLLVRLRAHLERGDRNWDHHGRTAGLFPVRRTLPARGSRLAAA